MEQNGMDELRELVQFLKENGIAEFDMERPDLKVRLKFAGAAAPAELVRLLGSMPQQSVAQAAPTEVATMQAAAPAAAVAPVAAETLHEVRSPLVGTFYESASPGAAPFVKIGDHVELGQVLCIVEAMKLMNEIESDVAGEVVQRVAVTGQPVEYGQALFTIRPR